MSGTDAVRVTTRIALDPAACFAVFTEEVDLWWKRGPRFRFDPTREGRLAFEPGPHGRLVERFEGHFEGREAYEVGRILAWEPPHRLVFEFRPPNFAADERTEVEVRFEAEQGGTRVTLVHRGWDSIAPDHPARRAFGEPAFTNLMGVWWSDLAVAFRARAAAISPGDRR